MRQLSPQDAQFLFFETGDNLGHFTGAAIYDPSTAPGGHVRFKDIIAHVESRIFLSPIFRQRLVRVPGDLDYPYWVDDEFFDLEYHIRHSRLPEPGDWRQFCIHLARYHSRPLNMQRPLWEMYVVEGLDRVAGLPAGSYALVTKVHHAALDGGAAMRFMGALNDLDAAGTPALPLEEPQSLPGGNPGAGVMLQRAMVNNLKSPWRLMRRLAERSPLLVQAARSAFEPKEQEKDRPKVPYTRFEGEVSPHKMFDATVFSLDALREIKAAVDGATVNDVVLAICSGALREYLLHHNELPRESLIAWVPINARKTDGGEKGGNHIAAMTSSLQTHLENPLERLRAIRNASKRSKEAKSGLSARIMTDLSQHVPAATQLLAIRLLLRPALRPHLCNLFISNVPGPQIPLYANGARLVRNFSLAPLSPGMGLFIATPSYNGEMTFNVTSTREILPDIEFFVRCLRSSYDALAEATRSPTPKKKNKSAGTRAATQRRKKQ